MRLSDLTNQGNLDADCLGIYPLSHLLRKCQLSQRESREAGANFLPYAQTKLVSPSGRDVAQRQRGLAPSLRELDLPQAKTEGAASYLSRIRQTLARTRQRAAPSVTACAVPPSSGRKAFVLRANKNRASFDTLSLGGRWWIRTTEVVDNRFTVCPLWPLGKPPIFTCRNRGAGGRT